MLILSRRFGEHIMIGDEVQVSIVAIKGNQVRLGIKAPTDIPVHRQEIYERLKHQKLQGTSDANAKDDDS